MLRIGIIGTGIIACEHGRAINMLHQARLVAAADIAVDRLKAFGGTFGVSRLHENAASLMADPDVDLVAITTPPSSHEALVIAALDAGKYVVCEKPLAHSWASARRIATAEALHPGRLAVSHQLRYTAGARRLRWLVQRGAVGEVQSALIERNGTVPEGAGLNDSWWGRWDTAGGGVLITQLIHEIDLVLLIMGRPVSVRAFIDTRLSSIESEDYVDATITFESGREARCVGSVNSGHLGGSFVIRGTGGAAAYPGIVNTHVRALMRELNRALPDTRPRGESTVARGIDRVARRLGVGRPPDLSPHAHLYVEIARCIGNGSPLPIPPSEALKSLEVCMAAYESALSGREVALPLAEDSVFAEGISKQAYEARAAKGCAANGRMWRTAPVREGEGIEHVAAAMLPRASRTSSGSLGDWGAARARNLLALAGVDGQWVRALVRRRIVVHGGLRVRRRPWPPRRAIGRHERRAVIHVLDREILHGNAVVYGGVEEGTYCEAFASFMGGGFADAVNSGTNAVYIAIRALDLPPGSEIVVPPTTDPGGTMPVVMNLCIPVPTDSAPGSVLPSADQIRAVLNDRTAAILVAHIAGHPVDMDPILALANEHGLPVIEDCAQAHGALYKGRMVGTLGTIAAFSTMYAKHHATGAQGGVVFTRDPFLFARAKQVADRGKTRDGRGHQSNAIASLNFNQDEISMAIGRVQLEKLPAALEKRRTFVATVAQGLATLGTVAVVEPPAGCVSAYLFMMFRLDLSRLRCDAHAFAKALAEEGIDGADAGYSIYPTDQPWHREGAVFGASGLPWSLAGQRRPQIYPLENARRANKSLVRLDLHESLGPAEAKDLVAAIHKIAKFFGL